MNGTTSLQPNMSMVEYQEFKALSAGMIWAIDSECPLKAWLASPWNPECKVDNAPHFDIGTAAHLAVLEPSFLAERVVVHEWDDYRTKDARAARDAAYAQDKTPLKPAEWAVVQGVQAAVQDRNKSRAAELFAARGTAEVTLTWRWDDLPCKCRPDFLAGNNGYIIDLKTANTCNPRAVARKAFNEGWFVRAAWYMAGVQAVTGVLPQKYLFVVVEKDAPHLIEIYELDDRALIYGDQIIMRTLKRAAECLRTGIWPSYGDGGITKLALPSWAEFQRAEREEAGEFEE
jgi:hypothetical protein